MAIYEYLFYIFTEKVHQYDAQCIMTGGLFSYHQEIVRIKQKYHVRQQTEAQGAYFRYSSKNAFSFSNGITSI